MTDPIRLGVLRLTDSAPAVLAEEQGLFAAEGLSVALHVEPSWANVADKLSWGRLDAAIMLLPLTLAMAAGLRGPPARLIVPMGISQGGNTVVISRTIACRPDGAGLRDWLGGQRERPRFAVVHVYSMHNLLLRHWLAACGVDPDRDLDIVVIPPERVVAELAGGRIAGFCAGAPWGDVAEASGAGRILLGGSAIRPRHPEKCLTLTRAWADAEPLAAAALVRAFQAAQCMCDLPDRAPALADLLRRRLDLPEAPTRATLPGGAGIERVGFAAAAQLDSAEVRWLLGEMRRWGWMDHECDLDALLEGVYCP